MRILFISKFPGWSNKGWGGDIHTTELAKHLINEGVEIYFINAEFEGSRFGIKFLKLPFITYRNRPYYPKKQDLEKFLRENKFDLIHHFSTMGYPFEKIRKQNPIGTNVPSICSLWTSRLSAGGVSSSLGFLVKGKPFRALATSRENYAANHADAVGVSSEAMKKEIEEKFHVSPEKIIVIPRGVEIDLFKKTPLKNRDKESGVILYAGRLEIEKGLTKLIQSLPEVINEFPKLKLKLIGEGKDKKILENLSKELEVEKNIDWGGRVSRKEMIKHYADSDIVILLSKFEPFGAILIEAGAVGRPAIGSNVGGPSEIILNGKTGYLVDPDDVKSISERIKHLLRNREELMKMGENANKRVRKYYTFQSEAIQYKKKYEKLIE
ncbi:MAG: glycosyltransferase family 4 protein [Candidatus Ranarchaeia archaeon]